MITIREACCGIFRGRLPLSSLDCKGFVSAKILRRASLAQDDIQGIGQGEENLRLISPLENSQIFLFFSA